MYTMLLLTAFAAVCAEAGWEAVAPLPGGRLNHCVAASSESSQHSGGTLFVVGGYDYPPPVYERSLLIYDAMTNAWSRGPNMSTSRDSFGCALVGDTLFAVAGESAEYPFCLASVETLNVSSPKAGWVSGPALQHARQGHGMAAVGNTLYVTGGLMPNGTLLSSVEKLDLGAAEPVWVGAPPMLQARMYHGLAVLGSTLYAIGGMPPGLDVNPLSSVEALDTSAAAANNRNDGITGGWRIVAPLPHAREKMAVATGPDGKGIYVLGGCPARAPPPGYHDPCDTLLSTVLVYTPSSFAGADGLGEWSALPSLPAPNAWLGAALMGSSLFATGGGTTYGTNGTYRLFIN